MPNEVLVECDNDQELVRAVLGTGVRLSHYSGKAKVSQELQTKQAPSRAMVDEDPDSIQPSYLASLKKPRHFPRHGLTLLTDPKRGHRVVMLSPRLEDWILVTAHTAGVNVADFGLPDKPAQFKQAARNNSSNFKRLLRMLASTPRLTRLKGLLLGTTGTSRRTAGRRRNWQS